MQLTNIKLRRPQPISYTKKASFKSVACTDINDILITLKQQEHEDPPKHPSKLTLKQKSDLYCTIIEECYKNKANQILLCSVLSVPFIQGPITLNSMSHLLTYRNSLNTSNQIEQSNQERRRLQRINKQLMPLFKYLQRIKQKSQYYFWMIFQDEELGIFNVKLFTKSEFMEIKEASQAKKKRNTLSNKAKKNHGNASSDSLKIMHENQNEFAEESLINWDGVLVGVFISDFNKSEVCPKERVMSMVGLTSTAANSVGLSNKNTKQSFNKTSQKSQQICKEKSISNYQPKINMTHCFNKKKTGEYQFSKQIKPSLKNTSHQYSFHKTNKTTYIVSQHQKNQVQDQQKSKLASHFFQKQKTKTITVKTKQLP